MSYEFCGFPKITRFNRDVVITEKLDGTNAQVFVSDDREQVIAGSKNRWLTPESDNYGFAKWVADHCSELRELGPGHHFGEWWGYGINRGYGLQERRFSLFNVARWGDARPACCHVVPVLWRGLATDVDVTHWLTELQQKGSVAAPGFRQPEGIVLCHEPSGWLAKMTLGSDGHKERK